MVSASGARTDALERLELLPKCDGAPGSQLATERERGGCRAGDARRLRKLASLGALVSALAVVCLCVLARDRHLAPQGHAAGRGQLRNLPARPLHGGELLRLNEDASEGKKPVKIIDKPQGDTREYQFAVLQNGLKVLNVLDKQSLQVAYAAAIQAGSFHDPVDVPGLAHFCEHMLFLGSKKFPKASGYDEFMAREGGFDNAYTADEVTVYYGEVTQTAGQEALERFADFLSEPLFSEKYVSKEVHAINSEHQKNTQSPEWRTYSAIQALASPDSPVSRFHTGDIDTLYNVPKKKGKSPVDALKVYFNDSYCPSKMTLVTLGSQPLDEQLKTAEELFGSIPEGNAKCKEVRVFNSTKPFGEKQLGKWQVIEGTTPQAELWLTFPMPADVSKEYESQPLEYFDYVLSWGGVGSLSRVLKDGLGLVRGIDTSYDMTSAMTQVFVTFTLTTAGTENLELIMDVFFAYLGTLRLDGVDEELYKTIRDVDNLKWNWTEPAGPSDAASDLAEALTRLPEEKVLTGDGRIDKIDVSLVDSLMKLWVVPGNMNAAFVDPHAGLNGTTSPSGHEIITLPHYDLKYYVQEISEAWPDALERWNKWLNESKGRDDIEKAFAERVAKAKLSDEAVQFPLAPQPIKDVPRDISLENMKATPGDPVKDGLEVSLYGPLPEQIQIQSDTLKAEKGMYQPSSIDMWYRSGWVTTSPKVHMTIMLSPLRSENEPYMSALDNLRLTVYSRLLGEELVPKMVDLTATGISYSVGVSDGGLSFNFGGFAPMLERLADLVLEEFNRFNMDQSITDPSRFERVMRALKDDLTTYSGMPEEYALSARSLLLTPGEYARNETLDVLESVNVESAATAVGELLLSRPMKLTSLSMGNFEEKEAQVVVEKVAKGIKLPDWVKPRSIKGEVEEVTPVVNPSQPLEVRMLNPRDGDENDVAIVSIIDGVATVESRVALGMLGQILRPLAYEELRTQRQLGYVVSAGSSQISNVMYVSAIVQGSKLRADNQAAAIEMLFNKLMPEKLEKMPDKELDSMKHAFEQELLQPPIQANQEISMFWGPVRKSGRCFKLQSAVLDYLNSTSFTKDLLVKTWADLMNPWKKGKRKKIMIKFFAGEVPPRPTEAEEIAAWKEQGVPDEAHPMLLLERDAAKVLDGVNSTIREEIVKAGGFFPTDLNCELAKGD